MAYMEDAMEYDATEKVIRVAYPLHDDADVQPDNYRQIKKVQESIESRVVKDGLTEKYNTEMRKMIDVGSVRRLGREEIKNWRGGCTTCPISPS